MYNSIKKKLQSFWGNILYYHYRHLYKKDPKLANDRAFKRVYHRHMDLVNPRHLIEKITWLQVNTDTSLWTKCADKLRMREYVEECGLGEYLPKLYGYWDSVYEVGLTNLPDQFVLKANNGCGTVKVVSDKSKLDLNELQKTLSKWLSRPYGYVGGEGHYLNIKPCILAEELLPITGVQANLSPTSLVDYKIWCFHGVPENCLIVYNRGGYSGEGMSLDLYDVQWNRLDNNLVSNRHYKIEKNTTVPKPDSWEKMLNIAKTLSKPFPEVRVDLYEINGKPYIGELTFSSGYGYFTEDYYNYLGSKIDLEKVTTKK